MPWIRQGTCNRCGDCCGNAGGKDGVPHSPFPSNWPEAMRERSIEGWNFKYASLLGVTEDADGKIVWEPYGERMIPSKGTFYYVWVPGVGLCKDTSAAHDGSEWSHQCPFLEPDDGTGENGLPHHTCPFVGTQFQDEWDAECGDSPPAIVYEQEDRAALEHSVIDDFFNRCPNCSYTYEWTE